jgi:hypothetical protein
MSHRSRLVAFVIDCQEGDVDDAARFWGSALGKKVAPATPEYPTYRGLETGKGELMLMVQRVDHPSRVHLDIESTDVEAEVKRLEALGAKRVAQVSTWWVLEAPTGQRFCVVRPQTADKELLGANEWP